MGRVRTLKGEFTKFLLSTIIGIAVATAIPILLFYVLVVCGELNLANISEQEAYQAIDEIKISSNHEKILKNLSKRVKYLQLDKENNVINSNMSSKEEKIVFSYLREGQTINNSIERYLSVEKNEETIILYYKVQAYFSSLFLDSILPPVEMDFFILMLLGILVNFFLQVNFLVKKFQKELTPILKATVEIGKQNLDYEIETSNIREFNEIQKALFQMRTELANAFKKQWEMQKAQQEQIAALAHDLKTPMTVAIGNLDLLCETNIDVEQAEYVEAATIGLMNMEQYIQILKDMVVSSIKYEYKAQKISLADFQKKIENQCIVLCKTKKIKFTYTNASSQKEFIGDWNMLERAFMNIITNAVEYTPYAGKIVVRVLDKDEFLCFQVNDTGKGFSPKMLHEGVQLFQMEDESRTSTNKHYGIGLYFAEYVAKQHNGKLVLNHSEEYGGARVELFCKKI